MRVFRFETVVFILVTLSAVAFAQERSDGTCHPPLSLPNCDYEKPSCKTLTDNVMKVYQSEVDACNKRRMESSNGCDDVKKKYSDAKNKMQSACSGFPTEKTDEGWLSCSYAVSGCNCSSAASKDTDRCNPSTDDDSSAESKALDAAKDKIKMCPALSGENLDAFEKKLKDQKDRIEKMRKEADDLDDKENKLVSSTNEKLQQVKDDLDDAGEKNQEKLKEAKRQGEAAQKAITDQIYAIEAQISDQQDRLVQEDLTLDKATLSLNASKTQIRLNCYKSALDQVGKMQDEVLKQLATNTYNRGGQAAMLRNVGVTDRQRWQMMAQKYYKWCLDSQPTVESFNSANDGYELAKKQSDKSKESIRQKIGQMRAAQRRLRDDKACGQVVQQANGQTSGETELCKAARQAYEDSMQIGAAYAAKTNALSQKAATLQNQGNREWQALETKKKQKHDDLDAETKRLKQLQDVYDLKEENSGGSNLDAKNVSKAKEAVGDYASAAESLVACTKPKDCVGDCLQATDFWRAWNAKSKDDPPPQWIGDSTKTTFPVDSADDTSKSPTKPGSSKTTGTTGGASGAK